MNAQQYLDQLQAAYPRYEYLLERLLRHQEILTGAVAATSSEAALEGYYRRLAEQAARVPEEALAHVPEEVRRDLIASATAYLAGKQSAESWVSRAHATLWNAVHPMLPPDLDLAVGELETASFNASAIPTPGRANSWVVALNKGVSILTYEVARTIASTFSVVSDRAGHEGGPKDRNAERLFDEAARLLHGRLNHYLHFGVPWGDPSEITEGQLMLASTATTMAERFVYLHELAHIILGQHATAQLQTIPGEWSEAQHILNTSDEEHVADAIAWRLLIHQSCKSAGDLQMAYAGVTLFLRVADILERAHDLSVAGTHPPAVERLIMIETMALDTCTKSGLPFNKVSEIGAALGSRLTGLLGRMPALPAESPLERLLDEASAGVVPDYVRFQGEMFPLLSHSAPSRLCRALGKALATAEHELMKLSPHWEAVEKAPREVMAVAHSHYKKLKLVGGLVALHLVPEIARRVERHRDSYLEEMDE